MKKCTVLMAIFLGLLILGIILVVQIPLEKNRISNTLKTEKKYTATNLGGSSITFEYHKEISTLEEITEQAFSFEKDVRWILNCENFGKLFIGVGGLGSIFFLPAFFILLKHMPNKDERLEEERLQYAETVVEDVLDRYKRKIGS